jgi:hypothetical protein
MARVGELPAAEVESGCPDNRCVESPQTPRTRQLVTLEVSLAWMSIPCMSVDYRDFINRDLPLVERGCTSKAGIRQPPRSTDLGEERPAQPRQP